MPAFNCRSYNCSLGCFLCRESEQARVGLCKATKDRSLASARYVVAAKVVVAAVDIVVVVVVVFVDAGDEEGAA